MRTLLRRASRSFLCLVSVLVFSCAQQQQRQTVAPESVGLSSEGLERATAVLKRDVDGQKIAGAVGLVARKGKIAYLQGTGLQDREANVAMAPDTIFRIASMTKPVTSVAVMILVDEGKLKLSDPIAKYIPEFKEPRVLAAPGGGGAAVDLVPAKREITVHDLLTHTSGLTYRFLSTGALAKLYAEGRVSDGLTQTEGTIGDMVKRLARLPLTCHPGERWEYGLSTDVLGYLVEIVSGMPLDRFFRERIFGPLRMEDTHFYLPDEKRGRLAAVYTPAEDGTIRRVGEEPVTQGNLSYSASAVTSALRAYFSGGGGLVSTAPDYARFLLMLLNKGELDGVRVLKPDTVELMTRNQIGGLAILWPVHGDRFGYGFGVFSEKLAQLTAESAGTYSWGGLYYTDFWVDPKR